MRASRARRTYSFRLDTNLIQRLDALAVAIAEKLGDPKPSRSQAIKVVLSQGLPKVEAKFGIK